MMMDSPRLDVSSADESSAMGPLPADEVERHLRLGLSKSDDGIDDDDVVNQRHWEYSVAALEAALGHAEPPALFPPLNSTTEEMTSTIQSSLGTSSRTSCPPMSGKIRNQYQARKTIQEALADCGDDMELRKAVITATECPEYKAGHAVPTDLLAALADVVGIRSQSKCKFPGCGKLSVRTDRAKEHARAHIGNHPFKCTRPQADGTLGCGATFLRKHDRNRHDNGADILTCGDCGASIQGKGREYNLQRHKANYCLVRKQAKQAEGATSSAVSNSQLDPQLLNIAMSQVHGPVPATSALPMVTGRGRSR
ncbi:hypothetical protein FRC17_005309 [Serendipita sp. 399]|nr:hypothetical protein FRC17_005309 [Serendipita sp. 399]